jgi:ankyrin repeat protein
LNDLLQAILADDLPAIRQILSRAPALAISRAHAAKLYRGPILHWLYARDTPLHLAAAGHRVHIARLLLAAGADPNAAANHRRSTPLHYAADGAPGNPAYDPARQTKMIQTLLAAGADVHAADHNGATALHRAVRTRSAAAVECLLQAGADPTTRSRAGSTPFHLAVQNTGRGGSGTRDARAAQVQIIRLMAKHGITPDLTDSRGKSIRDWARSDHLRALLADCAP